MRHPVHILLTNYNFEKHISNVSAMVDEILFTKVVKQCAPALLTQDGMYVRVANVVADHNIEGICK